MKVDLLDRPVDGVTHVKFEPHRLFRGGHAQTIAGAYLGRTPRYVATQHRLTLSDGDRLVLHDDQPPSWTVGERAVVLLHGLAGCHGSGYMARVAAKLVESSHRVFRMDQRGCGAGMYLARKSLHAGRWQDANEVAEFIAELCPGSPLTLIGFSLGASVILKLLGTAADRVSPNVDSAIVVAPPLDLQVCCDNLRRGWNRIYDRSFVRRLVEHLRRQCRRMDEFPVTLQSRAPATLYEFDTMYTAPLGGFEGVEDYYTRASSLPDLSAIRIPTTILTAKDDPLVPFRLFEQASFSPSTRVFATASGGHLGYIASRRDHATDSDWHWMDWRLVEWVNELPRSPRNSPPSPSCSSCPSW